MKKTLITLAALVAGSASALADGTLVWDLTVTGDTYTVTNADGEAYAGLSVSLNGGSISDGICTSPAPSNDQRIYITDNSSSITLNESFSFVIQGGLNEEPSSWGVLFGIGEANSWNIKVNADTTNETLGFSPEGYGITNQTRGGSISTGMGTYIVTYAMQDDSTATLSLYQNGALIATATQPDSNTTGEALDVFTIGGRPYDHAGYPKNSTDFSFTNVQLYEGVLSSEQIASLSVTPEPTTATLSLLALAGLCARRRRK